MIKVKNIYYLFVCLWLFPFFLFGQKTLLAKAKSFSVHDSSIKYTQLYLKQTILQSDTNSIIDAKQYLALVYDAKGLSLEAENNAKEAFGLSLLIKDKDREGLSYEVLAGIYKSKNDFVTSLKLYLKARDIFETQINCENKIKNNTDLAEYYRSLGKYTEAQQYINYGMNVKNKCHITDLQIYIRLYGRAAAIKNETNQMDSAIYFARKAMPYCIQIKKQNALARLYNEMGFAYKNLKQIDSAISCYQQAELILMKNESYKDALHAMNNRAMLYAHHSYPQKMIFSLYFKMIELDEGKKLNYPLDDVYENLSREYSLIGDTGNAYLYIKKFYELKLTHNEQKYNSEVNDIKEKYENEKIKKEIVTISDELTESQKLLQQKQRENKIIYLSITALLILLGIIGYLWFKNKQANSILQQKNNEKDALVQEIHHRVKNNLQFVSSLINMQMNASHNETEIYSLSDTSRRIRSMALVHEMLYNQDEIKGISIKQYLTELTLSINELINSKNLPIQFKLELDDIHFNIAQATALGMITSELISNSIKYAFHQIEQPIIIISLQHTETANQYAYTVQDNGCGIQNQNEDKNKLGMRLINIFSRQLKGDYTISNNNGLQYKIIFNL